MNQSSNPSFILSNGEIARLFTGLKFSKMIAGTKSFVSACTKKPVQRKQQYKCDTEVFCFSKCFAKNIIKLELLVVIYSNKICLPV